MIRISENKVKNHKGWTRYKESERNTYLINPEGLTIYVEPTKDNKEKKDNH